MSTPTTNTEASDAPAVARRTSPAADLALIAVFAGVIAALAMAPAIPVGVLAVPITLQTFAIILTGMVLGGKRGFFATLLYVLVGLAGLPVFAGGTGGPGVVMKPSVGYLLSFPFIALIVGYVGYRVIRRGRKPLVLWLMLVGVLGVLFNHACGIVGMSAVAHLSLGKAAVVDAVYWPVDLIKVVLAAIIALPVHRAFPWLAAK